MGKSEYSEDVLIQAPTAEFLHEELKWDSVMAQDEGPLVADGLLGRTADTQVVLVRDVEAALRRLNPGLPDTAYAQALEAVTQNDSTKSLVQMNQEKYQLLRDGVLVKFRDSSGKAAGKLVEKRLRLIDFDKPERNRFLAVRELWVRGPLHLRRPDLIGYVNGLPLVFIELKRFEVHVDSAYKKNYADYLDTIPHLFHWNALVVISNGHDAQYGSITSSKDHFYRWKRLDEDDPEPGPAQPLLPLLLQGMLGKQWLLDIVENFVLFDASEDGLQKIVARNHQYLGVNRVIDRLASDDATVKAEVAAGQLGVFWHTQGSGKSYSMVFLTEKVRRKISASYTFVVVTDRSELDDQIAGTYTSTGRASAKADQAKSGNALRNMLRDQNRSYVFGLVQKYRERVTEPYSEREDIIVLSDEAHRSQYGRLALNMRKGLPKAKFLGFTGTPLIDDAEKQLTRQVFGDYVSIYDFKRAVADGATLPLFYENRGEKLKIIDPKVSERIVEHIGAAKLSAPADDPWTDEKEDKLYRALASEYPILTSPTRLSKVAADFVEHFHQRWQVVAKGASKSLVVCLDKITCVKLHDLIAEKWAAKADELDAKVSYEEALFVAKGKPPNETLKTRRAHVDWMRATEICVVVSQEQGEVAEFKKWKNHRDEALDITPHREKMVKRNLEEEFKKPENPFRVAIVCAMWLTGFDVKCLATMYLDKPMQGHTLMQAIARVNRVGGGKKHGLVIDYNGMLKSLRKALATFAQGDRKGTGKGDEEEDTVRDDSVALAEYANSLLQARHYLEGLGVDLDAVVEAKGFAKQGLLLDAVDKLAANIERRKTYEVFVDDIQARYRALFPNPGLFEYDAEEGTLAAIYNKLQDARTSPDISALLQSLYEVVDTALTTDGQPPAFVANQAPKRYNLSKINFERLKAEFAKTKHKAVAVLNLQEQLEKRLAAMLAVNPMRVDLYERYQNIIAEYNRDKSAVEVQKVMDDLFALNDKLNDEEKRYLREGLDNDAQLAVFDLLQKDDLTKSDRDKIKKVAKDLLDTLANGKLQIDHWREKAAAQAQVKAEIIKHLWANLPGGAYEAEEIDAKAGALFAHIFTTSGEGGAPFYH
ncbi:type I restriction endonuclease subunit R [Comamonas piscis]|uniref:Type I restriction enzyme endonuclease subunit n=1 Tax=Comamonas piscis TaxID=1562974 RepID=A0A7G5EHQ0_9BURK|nr:type I restriction endonuclease subunit R [Comamonas piscis]QMV73525.1 type I restriction endonuclease subunit R [Comamonas piscis]WSO31942.1 type I restriction endonuclease subunit R [Comamonas piscis]